jgi:pimeloyl-ACP methyl ester carboxylesterase
VPLVVGLLAGLAASAAFVRYQTKKVESENPPRGKFVEVNGVRLHYIERGEGQTLVVLHGNGTSSQEVTSSGLMDIASATYRVIAFDRPGYGYSERPGKLKWGAKAQAALIHGALQQLGIEKPIIVAHSWGTLVAIALGLQYPDDVQGLVLLSGYYYPTPRVDVPLFSPVGLPIVGDALRYTVAPVVGWAMWPAFVRKLFAPASTPQRFKSEYPAWMTLRPTQLRATTEEIAMMIPVADELSDQYRQLRMPIVIMAGKSDLHALPQLHSERLHSEIAHSKLFLVPHVGHMITHSALTEVMAGIEAIKQTVDASPASEVMKAYARPDVLIKALPV